MAQARVRKARASRAVELPPSIPENAPMPSMAASIAMLPPASILLPPQSRYERECRLFEIVGAAAMLLMAVTIAVFPESVRFSGFHKLEGIYLDALPLAMIFFMLGCMRVWALSFANGPGSLLRAIGAAAGLVIWLQMLYALASWSLGRGFLSLSCALYLCVAGGEVISLWRAVRDGRS